jgi:nucleotidyltransferase/DNA polymerase involved in DNA repair
VGLPFSIGVGRSKTLAKLFSDGAKPNGLRVVLDRAEEEALLAKLPVDAVSGIARARANRLAAHGIRTCLELARADRPFIRKLLTAIGEALWWELNGEPVLLLHTERPPHKIISRGGSLGEKTADPARLVAWLARNTERLVEALESHAVKTEELQVYLGHPEGDGSQVRVSLLSATNSFDRLLEAARIGLRHAWRGRVVNRVHLLATKLSRPGSYQLGLFDPPAAQAEAVACLKREVNAQVGRFALRSGATLPLYDVYRDTAQGYDICDVTGKLCF